MRVLRWGVVYLLLVLGVALVSAVCNKITSPAVPTPIPTVQYLLRWDRVAPMCEPRPIVPPVETHATLSQSGTELFLTYIRPEDLLSVLFHRVDQEWWLCDWDTSDN